MLVFRSALFLLLFCGLAPTLSAQAPRENPDQPIFIDDVTVIDVENRRALPNQSLLITGERIERIAGAGAIKPSADAKIISGKGLFVMPGLFDAHVHITPSVETFGPMLLANGVTAVRDLGATTEVILELRSQSVQRNAKMPQIICTGAIIDGDPPVWPFSEPCNSPEEARAAVRKLKAAGVDQIKVYSLLNLETYRAAVDEAHALGLKATGHVPNSATLTEALDAGQDCAEHMMGFERMLVELSEKPADDRQTIWRGFSGWSRYGEIDQAKLRARLKQVAEAKMTVCPTMVVLAGISRAADRREADADPLMAYVPVSLRAFWGQDSYGEFGKFVTGVLPSMRAMVKELHEAGVPLLVERAALQRHDQCRGHEVQHR